MVSYLLLAGHRLMSIKGTGALIRSVSASASASDPSKSQWSMKDQESGSLKSTVDSCRFVNVRNVS